MYHPGPSPVYAESAPSQTGYGGDQKSPYEGDRFKPKTRINDPFFLIFFILQVSQLSSRTGRSGFGSQERWWDWRVSLECEVDLLWTVRRIRGLVRYCDLRMGQGGWLGRRDWRRGYRQSHHTQLVRFVVTLTATNVDFECECSHTVILLLLVAAAAFVLSVTYLMLTRAFTRLIMHITLIMSIALNM